MIDWGNVAAHRLQQIAQCSEPGPGVTRLPFTEHHRAALQHIRDWMKHAGLTVTLDDAGTMIGRHEAPGEVKTFLFGSHQDSVPEGGSYDGIMGVLLPCLAMEALGPAGRAALPVSIEVLAFADEEGVRFPTALMGPRALAGSFEMSALEGRDADGVTLAQAMSDFGLNPENIGSLRRDPTQILGYLETHIEQGPVLETLDRALGVVTAIAGIERHHIRLEGEAAHAGTSPMDMRRDALAGAAGIILAVEHEARAGKDLRATIGQLALRPGAVNAVPGQVKFPLELRAGDDRARLALRRAITVQAQDIAATRGLKLTTRQDYEQAAVPTDPGLSDLLDAAAGQAPMLLSGATHDASAMADLCPIAMLFLRCRNGVSHNPAEYASPSDMSAAIGCLVRFLQAMR